MSSKLLIAYVVDAELPNVTAEDARKLTHINIAFGLIRDGLLCMDNAAHMAEIRRIRALNPAIRIVLSVGGWGAGGFSEMAATAENRKKFIDSVLPVVAQYGLDGIDIDWEYPGMGLAEIGYDENDKYTFTALLQDLRTALGPEKIVSVAVGAGDYFIAHTQMDQVAAICSYVQLMTYDIRSGFESEAGHHTCLFTSAGDRLNGSVKSSVDHYAAAGVPKDKMVIGAAFYARIWKGVPDVNHGLFQKAATVGGYGAGYTKLKEDFIGKNGYVRYWDDEAQAPYLFNGNEFVSYDDPESIARKCRYVYDEGLLGIMYWQHGSDPSRDLLTVMQATLRAWA